VVPNRFLHIIRIRICRNVAALSHLERCVLVGPLLLLVLPALLHLSFPSPSPNIIKMK
jgi:hypothetical protein